MPASGIRRAAVECAEREITSAGEEFETIHPLLAVTALVGGDGEKSKPLPIRNAETELFVYDTTKDRSPVAWEKAVGKRVVAEGLAWGAHEKGLGERVLLDGGYLHAADVNHWPEGKLVRVVGTLKLETYRAGPPGSQTYGVSFRYFTLEEVKFREIPRVEFARLRWSRGQGDQADLDQSPPWPFQNP